MTTVECQICGEEFDPDAQGGHCTNPDCGKWQYDPDEEEDESGGDDEPETIICPSCGETIPKVNFCSNCSHEIGSVEETQECSQCNETVPQLDYCTNCGNELQAPDSPSQCPSCDHEIDPDDNFCANCGQDLTETADKLTLEFMGEEFEVSDGDIIGRQLRSAAASNGIDRNDALKIHREHVEFEQDSDGFYLIDHGENDTLLNDEELSKGDRRRVEPGDEIQFHDVGTATVRKP